MPHSKTVNMTDVDYEPTTLRRMKEYAEWRIPRNLPHAMLLDTQNGETHSASPGDYWQVIDPDEVFTGEDDRPLALVVRRTTYVDAITGKEV